MMRRLVIGAGVAAALLLSACGEQVQTVPVAGKRKADQNSWAAASNPYLARGWTPGDEASWEAHLRRRTQGQNDYSPRI